VSKNSELKYFFLKRVVAKDAKVLIVFSDCEHTKGNTQLLIFFRESPGRFCEPLGGGFTNHRLGTTALVEQVCYISEARQGSLACI
jgi:hypothetical protein